MRQIGLRLEILFNILFLTAVAMFLIGIIAFKVTERFALQGKIDGAKSIIVAFESLYAKDGDLESMFDLLKDFLEPGAWMLISDRQTRRVFHADSTKEVKNIADPLILEVMKTGRPKVDFEGINIPPFAFYKGFMIASPLKRDGKQEGVVFLYQPLHSLEKGIISGQRLIAISIILDLIVIALFGFYVLSKRVIRPVHELIETTGEIARGRFPFKKNLGGVKEIVQLNDALRKMYDEIELSKMKLKENIKALEESNQALLSTQKELIASEKLASLGKLSAGIAHEIGNPLSAIKGYVELLKKGYILQDDKRAESLSSIEKELERIDGIIRTLLDYSRPRGFALKRVGVNDIIKDAAELVKSQGFLKNIDLQLDLATGLNLIEIDPYQLSQVLINLILNARDAILRDGVITISSLGTPNEGVEISVTDNGVGIPKEIIDKIFDPFFTTKDPGRGTGLGLSVSQRIVQHFGGRIRVQSEPEIGSVFRITFPGVKDHGSQGSDN